MTRQTGAALALLAVVVALPSLTNGFVYDDVPLIVENPLVHSLGNSAAIWHSRYWPTGLLYRPLTLQLFSLEWALGSGRPLLFHAISILLAMLSTLLVWRLARRILPEVPALIAAALFAVHPVHVEAVANAVGQSELLVAVVALFAVERFVAWRDQGALGSSRRLILAGLTLLAIASKETGYVTPALLLAAELCFYRDHPRSAGSVFVLQAGAVGAALLVRLIVLGSLAGETPAAIFQALSAGGRAIAMLGVVPQWARLLFWPLHLQGEYGPPALPFSANAGAPHLLGALLLLACIGLVVWGWRHARDVSFGVLWMGIALVPVSNLLAPTGVLLAERTLFLPSVGAMLVAGGLAARAQARIARQPGWARLGLAALGAALIAGAGIRSAERQRVWRSQVSYFDNLLLDAPDTYRAHYLAGRYYYSAENFPAAEREARRALELYAGDAEVHNQLGRVLRTEGRCAEAVPILTAGVRLDPSGTTIRSRLIECSLAAGDTAGARAVAEEGVRRGQAEFAPALRRLTPP